VWASSTRGMRPASSGKQTGRRSTATRSATGRRRSSGPSTRWASDGRRGGLRIMAKPWIHAESSARKFGGQPEDYLAIHNHLDSTKGAFADNRHRAITPNAWYIGPDGPLERAFGPALTNSDGRRVPVRSVAEQHVLEDFGGFIPTLQ